MNRIGIDLGKVNIFTFEHFRNKHRAEKVHN